MTHSRFFRIPGSEIQGLPLSNGMKNLAITLVEVGCKPRDKKVQVASKRTLLGTYCREEYRGTGWRPKIRSIVAHWDPMSNYSPGNARKVHVDTGIHFSEVTEGMLSRLDDGDIDDCFRFIRSFEDNERVVENIPEQLGKLEGLLKRRDTEEVYELISDRGRRGEYGLVRGILAEKFSLGEIANALPEGVNLFSNGIIDIYNRKYARGTEVDGILTHYGKKPYDGLLASLEERPYIQITRKRTKE